MKGTLRTTQHYSRTITLTRHGWLTNLPPRQRREVLEQVFDTAEEVNAVINIEGQKWERVQVIPRVMRLR